MQHDVFQFLEINKVCQYNFSNKHQYIYILFVNSSVVTKN